MEQKTVGILGFGRFGQFWAGQLKKDFAVLVNDVDANLAEVAATLEVEFLPLSELCNRIDTLFICVPINQFESAVEKIQPYIRQGMCVLDVCSVKEHPAHVMKKLLPIDNIDVIATHPMFGPDSGSKGLKQLRFVMYPISEERAAYKFWRTFFKRLGLQVVEMSPSDHDRLAAYSQGITHYIGRVLERLDLNPTAIDTKGFEMVLSVIEQTCNDTEELFRDLQNYNKYTSGMRRRLDAAMRNVYGQLIPAKASPNGVVKIGIQGGQGSFNEQACREFCKTSDDPGIYEIDYLMRSERVLLALQDGQIDRGVFALYNTTAGIVKETVEAMSKYPCEILSTTEIVISHCIAYNPRSNYEGINILLSHEQPLIQCKSNLNEKYPQLKLISTSSTDELRGLAGTFFTHDLRDQATCAKFLSEGKLPKNVCVLVPRISAELYGLRIKEENLQDGGDNNRTTFAWAARRSYEDEN